MKIFCLYAFVLICIFIPMSGQISVTFTPDKAKILSGEPVYINVNVKNESKEEISIEKGSLYNFCSGIIFQQRSPAKCEYIEPGGSCPSGIFRLKPGESFTERVLLNHYVDFTNTGEYKIEGIKYLNWVYGKDPALSEMKSKQDKRTEFFYINVDKVAEDELPAIYTPYLEKLKSVKPEVHYEALRVLSEAPSPFLEPILLDATGEDEIPYFVIKGLQKLNSTKARARLMELAEVDALGYIQTMAIQALGDMGDKSYVSRLKTIAEHGPANSNAFRAALGSIAQLDGEESVVYLVPLLQSSDAYTRGSALAALGLTKSKWAVSILIPMLKDTKLMESAHGILQVMTRRKGPVDFQLWSNWWMRHQKEAEIYDEHSCSPYRPLESGF